MTMKVLASEGASEARLDAIKHALVALVAIGHFIEPFVAIGNAGALAMAHWMYQFHVPAFVLLSGYFTATPSVTKSSGESGSRAVGDDDLGAFGAKDGDSSETESVRRERRSRRMLVTRILLPYLALELAYRLVYSRLYFDKELYGGQDLTNAEELTVRELYFSTAELRVDGEFTNNFWLMQNDPWFSPMTWDASKPFFHLWYLITLFFCRLWAPIALELRGTLFLHVVAGALAGYTSMGKKMSLMRTVVLMPYFLLGGLMRRENTFFPAANTSLRKTMAFVGIVAMSVVAALLSWKEHSISMWKGHAAYSRVYAEHTATYGGLIQLTIYLWTLVCITVFFSLFPNAESAIIKANDDVGRTYDIRDGHRSTPMRIFRQFAAFGAQSLYAYLLHVALLILVERLGFFDVTWRVQLVDFSSSELIDFSTGQESLSETQPLGLDPIVANDLVVYARLFLAVIIAVATTVLLSARRIAPALFGWLLVPVWCERIIFS